MKEASGELSMTLIVIVAAGAILALFMAFREPIMNTIQSKWREWSSGEKYDDVKVEYIIRDFNIYN